MADMREEVVSIGCRIPAGLIIEVGLQTTIADPITKRPITMVGQTDKYRRVFLRGTHTHTQAMRREKIQVPAIRNPLPYINKGVPKTVWEEWSKTSIGQRFIKNDWIFLARDGETNQKAQTLDVMKRDAPLNPIDPNKAFKFGENTVETAKFDDDTGN